nr:MULTISPECIES: hypothetical protein [Mycobacterium ulcerans group]
MAIVVDTAADTVRAGRLDERRRRRMRARIARLNETALLVQSQIEDKTHPATLWPGISAEQLAPWLFDAELSVEWVAIAGHRAMAIAEEIPAATRIELADTLTQLAWAIRGPRTEGLHQAASRAQRLLDGQPAPAPTDDPSQGAVRPARSGQQRRGAAGTRGHCGRWWARRSRAGAHHTTSHPGQHRGVTGHRHR